MVHGLLSILHTVVHPKPQHSRTTIKQQQEQRNQVCSSTSIKHKSVLRIDENEQVNVRFFQGGLRACLSNLLLYIVRSRLAQLLIYVVLIITGTTRRTFRKGKALLLKVGSVIPISDDSQDQR